MFKNNNMHDYDSAILLIRSPFKAHIADFNRLKSFSKTGFAAEKDFLSTSMALACINRILECTKLVRAFICCNQLSGRQSAKILKEDPFKAIFFFFYYYLFTI